MIGVVVEVVQINALATLFEIALKYAAIDLTFGL